VQLLHPGRRGLRRAIVVDPGDEVPRILAVLQRHKLTVKQILITHAHIDHIAGAARLQALTGAPILYNQNDLPLVKMMAVQAGWLGVETPEVRRPTTRSTTASSSPSEPSATDRQPFPAASSTPPATPRAASASISGAEPAAGRDTLFAGSVGRTDLPGGDGPTLLRSIHNKLLPLPDATVVLPGHGPKTTIATSGVRIRS